MIGILAIGLNVIAVIIFIFLVLHYRKKWQGIKHYEKIRDKLTVREEEPEDYNATGEATSGFFSSGMIGHLIGGFIVILVGINVMSVVTDDVTDARFTGTGANTNASNLTGAASTILGLTPLFFALGIMSAGVALAIGGLRNVGLIGEYEEPEEKANKNKRNGIKHYEGVRDKVTKK